MIGKPYEYEAMAKCERKLWWYKCLHDLTLNKIETVAHKNAMILDAGCGTGGMLSRLQERGFTNLTGFDLSTDAIKYAAATRSLNVQLLDILECDTAYLPNTFDVVISHDILCLLNDGEDKAAFDKLVSLLKPGGFLMMNLPAGKYFKGTHDSAVGIKKRFSKQRVRELTRDTPVKIREIEYWPFALSPLIFSLRTFQRSQLLFSKADQYKSDVSLPHPLLNELFYRVTSFENKTMNLKPWGSSVFVTLVKL